MDFQTWLQIQLNWRDEPGLWLLGSFLLYVLASNVAWILGRQRSGRLGRAIDRLLHVALDPDDRSDIDDRAAPGPAQGR